METETIAVLFVGIVALSTVGAVASSVASPQVDGAEYALPGATERLLIHPTTTDDVSPPSRLEVYGVEADLSGDPGWLTPIAAVAVLGLWLVMAMRAMGPPAVALLLLTGGMLLALVLLVGQGGTPTAVGSTEQPVSLLGQLVTLLVGMVTVLSAVALVIPDDADAYSTDIPVLRTVRSAIADFVGWRPDRGEPSSTPVPDNDIYRAWSAFTDRVSGAAGGQPATARTPGELAAIARRSGAPAEAVQELKRTFEQVRYGHAQPTETRIKRAVDAWQRIDGVMDDTCDG